MSWKLAGLVVGVALGSYFIGMRVAVRAIAQSFGYPVEEIHEQVKWYSNNPEKLPQ